ncbi:tetratricopeptide repeat protein [Bombilactobacillus bombi]|uniref:tetratricopeptide repeat protein n=1 Tax=Bombilactobacillus bombi TaxID=1303590 RepID=UPI0015E60A5D|nr:tetratricopeptide repeat protein [Bombilactobacillus bombi]MBA1434337.1 tetratricopeptide repeat protein [Bombilactobacillus bombi]
MELQADELYKQGQKQAAVKLLAQKLQKDMHHIDWFLQLSSYLTAGGDFTQAEELLLKAKQLFPGIQELDYNLAVIYFEAGKFEQSQKILKNITNPKLSSDIYYLIAKQLLQQKQVAQALAYALTAIDKNPNLNDNYVLVGDIFLRLKQFSKAADYYQQSIKVQPSAAGYFKLALMEMVLDKKQFRQHFQQAQSMDSTYFQKHQQQLAEIERYIKMQSKDDS